MTVTKSKLNRAMAEAGIDAKIGETETNYYVYGPRVDGASSTTIDVYRLNHLTMDQWMARINEIVADADGRPTGEEGRATSIAPFAEGAELITDNGELVTMVRHLPDHKRFERLDKTFDCIEVFNGQIHKIEYTRSATMVNQQLPELTDASSELFKALWDEAADWSGTPFFEGTKAERGNLTDLKKKGLLITEQDHDNKSLYWVHFTARGHLYAKSNGMKVMW